MRSGNELVRVYGSIKKAGLFKNWRKSAISHVMYSVRIFWNDIRNQRRKQPLTTDFQWFWTMFDDFTFFDQKSDENFYKKIKLIPALIPALIPNISSKNRTVYITWLTADFLQFFHSHAFCIDPNTLISLFLDRKSSRTE